MKREQIFDCIEHLNGLEDLKIIVNSYIRDKKQKS